MDTQKLIEDDFKYIFIDGLNFCHRFFWTMKNLRDKKGRPTGLLYGVLNNIYYLQKKFKRAKIVFLWDSPGLKRKEVNLDYKADRKRKDDTFYSQVKELKNFLSMWGIVQICAAGYEADDLAGRYVRKYSRDKKILLVSRDSDWSMFVNKNVFIYKDDIIYSEKDIFEQIGYDSTEKFKAYLCIVGTHNNVKGVKNLRRKCLKDIIDAAGCIENVFLMNLDKKDSCSKILEKIKENKNLIMQNKKMIEPMVKGYKPEVNRGFLEVEKFFEKINDYNMNSLVRKYTEWFSR